MGIEKLIVDQAFTYQENKDAKIMIFYYNKQVMIVQGEKAKKLALKLAKASLDEQQLILAKATGNFKRGNERLFSKKR